MNFLSTSTKGLTPNAPMTEEQVEIATEFVDELWCIGVFELVPEGSKLLANAPLFTMPKSGQLGQWYCIADMKSGGKMSILRKIPQAQQILEWLYMDHCRHQQVFLTFSHAAQ